jgi:hypothetical protein
LESTPEPYFILSNLSGFVQLKIMTILVLSGAPGIGKTTSVLNAAKALKQRGLNVGGIVSREMISDSVMTLTVLALYFPFNTFSTDIV